MSDPDQLRREIERRDEEIARLRGLLLAKEAELGEALGRTRELEDFSRLLFEIAIRVRNRLPAVTRFVRWALGKLRGPSGSDGA
jgi:hypothetical protein